jgi:alpha-L-fucosidase 2
MNHPRMLAVSAALLCCTVMASAQDTAWHDGHMQVNVANVIGRSDIVLGRPNKASQEALPLGNGRLGIAVWSEEGFTAQLNRGDTLPYRYSTGQVVIPGLAALTSAPDYAGRLNLYNGAFEEHGGGMTATAYVQPGSDLLIIDVTGADPTKPQTAQLKLWEPRKPQASAQGTLGVLAERWVDDKAPGASGRTFGPFCNHCGRPQCICLHYRSTDRHHHRNAPGRWPLSHPRSLSAL